MKSTECPLCEKRFSYAKKMKKIAGMFMCKHCEMDRREKRRKENIIVMKKEGYMAESRPESHQRCLREGYAKQKRSPRMPKIKGEKKPRRRSSSAEKLGMALTTQEKVILFKKYQKHGMSDEDANILVKQTAEQMKEFGRNLRKQKMAEEKKDNIFKKAFEELIKG